MIMTETIEEAGHEYFKREQLGFEKAADTETAFIKGAKRQAERSYDELSIYLQELADKDRLKSLTSNQIRAMIEQFKKNII